MIVIIVTIIIIVIIITLITLSLSVSLSLPLSLSPPWKHGSWGGPLSTPPIARRASLPSTIQFFLLWPRSVAEGTVKGNR